MYITKSQGYNDDSILQKDVADELEENPDATIAKSFPKATVLFTDIVGLTKMSSEMQADDTVNVASRMESTGRPHQIHVSEQTYLELKKNFIFKENLDIDVKGKGLMHTYFI